MSQDLKGSLEIEDRHLLGRDNADLLDELVERADHDPNIRAGEPIEFLPRRLAPAARSGRPAARWGWSP